MRRVIPWLALGLVAVLLFTARRPAPPLREGRAAPALTADLAAGGRFDLSSERGHVVVVNFWAGWCPPCQAEAPVLARAHAELTRLGGKVVGLSVDDASLEEVVRAAAELGMTYPVACASQEIAQAFRVESLPTTYVIDPHGRVHWSHVGAVSDDDLGEAIRTAAAVPLDGHN